MYTFQRNRKAFTKLLMQTPIAIFSFLYLAWTIFDSSVLWRIMLTIVFIFFTLLLLFIAVVVVLELLNTEPALEIDKKGINDKVSFAEIGFISWENIEKIFIDKIQGKAHIIIQLKKEFVPQPTSNLLKRSGRGEVIGKYGNAIAINEDYVCEDLDVILSRIERERAME